MNHDINYNFIIILKYNNIALQNRDMIIINITIYKYFFNDFHKDQINTNKINFGT
jgi:hypothetical protein